jgi:hypothetical protein
MNLYEVENSLLEMVKDADLLWIEQVSLQEVARN